MKSEFRNTVDEILRRKQRRITKHNKKSKDRKQLQREQTAGSNGIYKQAIKSKSTFDEIVNRYDELSIQSSQSSADSVSGESDFTRDEEEWTSCDSDTTSTYSAEGDMVS